MESVPVAVREIVVIPEQQFSLLTLGDKHIIAIKWGGYIYGILSEEFFKTMYRIIFDNDKIMSPLLENLMKETPLGIPINPIFVAQAGTPLEAATRVHTLFEFLDAIKPTTRCSTHLVLKRKILRRGCLWIWEWVSHY
jgi:hypothetical protein